MKIVCPSYHRANVFRDKTMKYLLESGVKPQDINVFVVEEDKEKYEELGVNVIVGKKGLCQQRNFITDYYDEGEYIASFDDDVSGIREIVNGKKQEVSALKVICDIMECLDQTGLALGGVRTVDNLMRVKTLAPEYGHKFIVGAFRVCRNDRTIRPNMSAKEDYDRCGQNWIKYGATVRLGKYILKTQYDGQVAGGLSDYYKTLDWNRACDTLIAKYPQFFAKKYRKNGRPEIRVL